MRQAIVHSMLVLALAAAAQAAPQRTTSFIEKPEGTVWRNGYTSAQGGSKIEQRDGGLPIVQHQGRSAVKINVTHAAGGSFHVGLVRPGWSRFYLDDYGPAATLDIELSGQISGEARIELVDMDRDGQQGPDTSRTASLALDRFGKIEGSWKRISIPLAAFLEAKPDLRLESMEKIVLAGSGQSGQTTLNISALAIRTTEPERSYPAIKVNQVGYRPAWRKVALVTPKAALPQGAGFEVLDAASQRKVHSGRLTLVKEADEVSGDRVYAADFTGLREPGSYIVKVAGLDETATVRIAADVLGSLLYDSVRFYYYQRCGMELTPDHAGTAAHPACHTADKTVEDPRGGTRDASGGWHDAGDMNRYAGWTIHAVGFPLLLFQHFPDAFTDGQFKIPESGNGVPDLLDEVKYELEWSRRMLIRSGPDAGRVYDRIHESGVEQPEGVSFYDIRRKLVEPTAESSLSFIANMAQAAIVYGRFPQEKEFADACLADAILAWEAMGKAGKPDESQHFTAAALLFEATGREDAHNVVKAGAGKIVQDWPGHINYRGHDIGLAVYSLSKRPEVDKATQKSLRDHYRRWADLAIEAAESRGYREPMMPGVEFTWGSNSIIARSGAHLLIANRVAPSPRYVQGAQDALHWLLGRNPVNQCMISGHGTPPLDAVFHSMYGPIGPGLPLPPGYLAGGVNRFDAPGISAFHAKCWRPDHTCWQITECSIGYQGPFVYLLGALAAPPPAAR